MRLLLGLPLLVLVTTPATLAGRQAPAQPSDVVSYAIDAELDAANHLITGHEHVTWRNRSSRPATELRVHLAWNAWRDGESSWMHDQHLAGIDPLLGRTDDDLAFIDVTSFTIAGGAGGNLMARSHFVAPDDGNAADRTLLAVPLDAAVVPGATVEADVAWNAHVPRPFDRTGVIGRSFMIAAWFPQLASFDADGWHGHQTHVGTGLDADFGDYDVRITVPESWVIGATGHETARLVQPNGRVTHRYAADRVNDVAWAAGPDLIEQTQRIRIPGAPPVAVHLLLQPEHADQLDRHLTVVKAALAAYARWLGPFPWPDLTVVDPVAVVNPRAQGASLGGGAYPMLITSGARWLAPWTAADPEDVVIRGIGREYWSALAAPDPVRDRWLDEGLAAFATSRVRDEVFPGRFVRTRRYFDGLVAWPDINVPRTRAADDLRSASPDVARDVRWLDTLEGTIGAEAMRRTLRSYLARAAWRHGTVADFEAAANEVTGRDLQEFFGATRSPGVRFDYAVGAVTSETTAVGAIDTTIVVRRLESGVCPVDVRATFSDGATVDEQWDGRDAEHRLRFRRDAAIVGVEIDPDRVLALDTNRTNNSWSASPLGARAADKWSLRWLTWFQHVLMTYAFFA